MKRPIPLLSKTEQLVSAFRGSIANGEWSGVAPGITRITRDTGAPRRAVMHALRRLEKEGELVRSGSGRAYRVAKNAAKVRSEGSVVVIFNREQLNNRGLRHYLETAESLLPTPVRRLYVPNREPTAKTLGRVLAIPAEIVLTDRRGPFCDALKHAKRQVVTWGRDGVSDTPFIATDYDFMIREAYKRCFESGHVRVSFPLWRVSEQRHATIRATAAEAYSVAGLRHQVAFDVPIVQGDLAEAYAGCVRSLFQVTPPTVLIIQSLREWMIAYTLLASLGKKVPEDVSVVCIGHVPELADCIPPVAGFKDCTRAFAIAFRRMVSEMRRGMTPQNRVIRREWSPGGSLIALRR